MYTGMDERYKYDQMMSYLANKSKLRSAMKRDYIIKNHPNSSIS